MKYKYASRTLAMLLALVLALACAAPAYAESTGTHTVEERSYKTYLGSSPDDTLNQEFPLYFADGEHASVYGDYLIAVTHCRLLSGRSILELPAVGCDFFDPEKQGIREAETVTTLDEEKCRIIRLAAEETFAEMGIGERK